MDRVLEILCWLLLFTRYTPDIYVPIEKDLVSPFNISSAVDNCLIPASIKTGLNQAIDLSADKEHLKSLLSISDLCRTPDCLRAAADILSNLDETAKPCDDFYKFACGGWIKRQNIPEDKLTFNVFEKARSDVKIKFRALLRKELTGAEPDYIHMVKRLYDSCIDLKSIEKAGSKPLRNALRDLGGWPVLEGKHWNETSFDWIATLTEFRKMGFDHNILMNLVVTRDAKNNMTPILKLDKVLLFGMGREKLSHGLNDSAIDAYFRLMVKTANQLGANENTSETELRETLDFEIMLANLSSTHGAFIKSPARMSFRELYNMSLDYTNDKYTVRKLVDTLPQIDWLKYFSDVLNATISENEPLIIKDPDFIVRLVNFITQTKKRVVANYMMWRVVLKSLPLLSKDWRALSLEHRRLSLPDADEAPRWEECLSYFPAKLELALNSFYLRHYKGKENKAMVTEIAEYIRGEVLNILESSAWLDERTKKNAIDKANAVTFKIAYPEELINETVISLLYPNVKLNKSHFSNRLKILKWLQDHFYVTYQDPTYNKRWHTSGRKSLRVTGIYYPENNVIDMSAGMIQDPYFNKDRPMYLNFGAVGLVIGHEFFHGFAGQGRKYDKNGNKVNWWSNETDSIYEKKALCIIQQYSNYTVGNGMKVNGLNTQPDNIADNAGLKAAYLAYQSWVRIHKTEKMLPGLKYTPNQLFFISAAQIYCEKNLPEHLMYFLQYDDHSPGQFRVNGAMSNLPEFAKEFRCSSDSAMNRQNKCRIW